MSDVWFLGGSSLKDFYGTLSSLITQATQATQDGTTEATPYIQSYYNLDPLYKSLSDVPSMLGRLVNALVDRMNDRKRPHLPRYIVIMLDKDLIVDAKTYDYGACDTFETTVQWLLHNIVHAVDTRKSDLHLRRSGALVAGSEP